MLNAATIQVFLRIGSFLQVHSEDHVNLFDAAADKLNNFNVELTVGIVYLAACLTEEIVLELNLKGFTERAHLC